MSTIKTENPNADSDPILPIGLSTFDRAALSSMASECHAPEVLTTASTSSDKPLCRGKGVDSGKNVVGDGGGFSEAEQLRIAQATGGGGDFSHAQQLLIASSIVGGGISHAPHA